VSWTALCPSPQTPWSFMQGSGLLHLARSHNHCGVGRENQEACLTHLLTVNTGQVIHKQVLRSWRLPTVGAMVTWDHSDPYPSLGEVAVSLPRSHPQLHHEVPRECLIPGSLLTQMLPIHTPVPLLSLHQHHPWQCLWWCHPQWGQCWWHCHGPR
jgi:hypothetical protein